METVRLALDAMNTRFELVLHGDNPMRLRGAGEEALAEVARIEELLSAFRPTSEIAHVNLLAAVEPVRVSPEVFALLTHARRLWEATEGAFDVTVGPLMRCWGFWEASGALPEPGAVEQAMERIGMAHLELVPASRTVRFHRKGMTVDLGGVGKGYAIDQAVEILRENGILSALLHGGTSSAYAIGSPPDRSTWPIAVAGRRAQSADPVAPPLIMNIQDTALSTSSLEEKSFTSDSITYGHVLDPRTGQPVQAATWSAVSLPRAASADAWSTALMVLATDGMTRLAEVHPEAKALVADADGQVQRMGFPDGTPGVE
jgi:thiamine biosynthesis lipoprotein